VEHPIVTAHRDGRRRITALLASLGAADAELPVAACPGWRVRDVAAHLAGIADDALHGRLDGVATDPWTARQVDSRRQRSLPEILAEWAETGPRFEAALAAGDPPDRLIIDQWAHEQDLRGALGRPGAGGSTSARLTQQALRAGLRGQIDGVGLAPLRVVTELDDWVAGDGSPAVTLATTWFDLARTILGRRSPAQMRAMAWLGDSDPYLAALPLFGPATIDLVEVPPPA